MIENLHELERPRSTRRGVWLAAFPYLLPTSMAHKPILILVPRPVTAKGALLPLHIPVLSGKSGAKWVAAWAPQTHDRAQLRCACGPVGHAGYDATGCVPCKRPDQWPTALSTSLRVAGRLTVQIRCGSARSGLATDPTNAPCMPDQLATESIRLCTLIRSEAAGGIQ
eukprot:366454-Chlamydomonas_euryale.AAC.18